MQSKFGASHPTTNTITNSIAERLPFEEARKLSEELLTASRRDSGPEHFNTLDAMTILLRIYVLNGMSLSEADTEEAQRLGEETLELAHCTLGSDADESLGTAIDLGQIHRIRGQHEQALKRFEETFAINCRVYGDDHFRSVRLMNELVQTLLDLGRVEAAAEKLQAWIELLRRRDGEQSQQTLTPMWQLAALNCKLGKHEEALQLYEQALQMCRRTHQRDLPAALRALAWFQATCNSAELREGGAPSSWRPRRAA